MIAISSHRPHCDASPEIRRNQIAANLSWQKAFSRIYYFGPPEPELRCTEFIPSEPFPTIRDMAAFASRMFGMPAIINADIVLLPDTFQAVGLELYRKGARSAFSFRYEYDPEGPLIAKNYDLGFDIFCAIPGLWASCARMIPTTMRIGHPCWDNWLSGFFNIEGQPCFEFTGSRCVFHPKHGDRLCPHQVNVPPNLYSSSCAPARLKLNVQAVVDIQKSRVTR